MKTTLKQFVAVALVGLGVAVFTACGSSSSPPATVSTATSSTTSTTSTTPCAAKPASATTGAVQLTVTPGTCLTGRETVTVSASGVAPDNPGGIAECNSAAGQPTVDFEGNQVPVGCTDPLADSVTTTSDRTFSASFTIITGITGPPASGTDTAGKQAMSDAVNYPCPPTSAQIAAGAVCNINFGDATEQLSVPISFVPNVPLTSKKAGSTLSSSSGLGGL